MKLGELNFRRSASPCGVRVRLSNATLSPAEVEHIDKALGKWISTVKTADAVGNNAAWMACRDAFDKLKEHRRWKSAVKGGGTVGGEYRRAMRAFYDYERRLLHATENRLFDVNNIPDHARKQLGENLTNREYYEFWQALGFDAYARTYPLYASLQNKYRLSLEANGVKDAAAMAWGLAAMSALQIAEAIHDRVVTTIAEDMGVPEQPIRHVTQQLSLSGVAKLWRQAVMATDPAAATIAPDGMHARNITHGLEQLAEAWASPEGACESLAAAEESYSEIFRTPGCAKKAIAAARAKI